MANQTRPTLKGFGLRWFVAILLVVATINTTQYNYLYWAFMGEGPLPLKLFVGAIFLIVYVIYLRATLISIGFFGVLFLIVLLGIVYWLGFTYLPFATSPMFIEMFIHASAALIMATGLYWSYVRRLLSAQIDGV